MLQPVTYWTLFSVLELRARLECKFALLIDVMGNKNANNCSLSRYIRMNFSFKDLK